MSDGSNGKVSRFPADSDPITQLLSDPLLDPALRLKDALQHLERLREEWVSARDQCDDIADAEKLKEARQLVTQTYHRYEDQSRQCGRLEAEVRKRSLEIPRAGQWKEEYESLVEDLKTQYTGLGPHYDLLCEHLASITVRIRMMEVSGRDVAGSELVELHKLGIGYVNQLQRYTEAMKSESVNKLAQDVANRLMGIADRHFGTTYPVQFREFVGDVRKAIEQGAEAA